MNERTAIFRPLLLAFFLALGFATVWAAAVIWCTEYFGQVRRTNMVHKWVNIAAEGTPIIESYKLSDYANAAYQTLDGKPVEMSRRYPWLPGTRLIGPESLRRFRAPVGWLGRIRPFLDDRPQLAVHWYLIHDGRRNGSAYFVGYQTRSNRCLGYLGVNGFQEQQPTGKELIPMDLAAMQWQSGLTNATAWRESFGGGSAPMQLHLGTANWFVQLISDDRLLEFDLHRRTARTILAGVPIVSISAIRASRPDDGSALSGLLAVRTQKELLIIDVQQGRRLRSYVLPSTLVGPDFAVFELADGKALAHVGCAFVRDNVNYARLVWFEEDGHVERQEDVALNERGLMERPATIAATTGLAAAAPLVATPTVVLVPSIDDYESGRSAHPLATVPKAFRDHWLVLLAVNLAGVAMAWFCYRRQRKYAGRHTWVWVAFVFLFGLPGLVGYLFHQSWPVRKACPTCQADVPRDRDACSACGADFPAPAAKGTEVLVAAG